MNEVRNILIGFELNREASQISYFDRRSKEPVTVSTKVGTNLYEFPTVLSKKKGMDRWFVGFEAEYYSSSSGAVKTENPFTAAEKGGVYCVDGIEITGIELLALFIRESLRTYGIPGVTRNVTAICITTEVLTQELVKTIRTALVTAGFHESACYVQDANESFCYFGCCQRPEVASRDLGLIRFRRDDVSFDAMHEDRSVKPSAAAVSRKGSATLPKDPAGRDSAFAEAVEKWMEDGSYSALFLTGTGFSTDWAKRSIKAMSQAGARVFLGDNLFSKGACWAAYEKTEPKQFRNRIYLSPSLVRSSVGIDVITGTSRQWLPLIQAGMNWYENTSECEILLCGRRDILVTVMSMSSGGHRNEKLELEGLPERPERASRIRIKAECTGKETCIITAEDMGFGEIFPSSGKSWSMEIGLEDEDR